ncbi:MAG TPA: DUF3667 domain-containing protein [Sphingomicrobium sp.]|jgi:hypothetical protein|nr:DUF3667 domain-containing protein [Sphingomicrobium sp.]
MVGSLEAIGDALTGAVLGRAVEPKAGEAGEGHSHETNCLNCGAELSGPFCGQCGQHAHVHKTLTAFFHDLAHGVFHLEGKLWNTIPMLAWRPGELTRRYIDGQRARFVSPIALFLFCVFLMFAVVGLTSSDKNKSAKAVENAAHEISRDQAKVSILQGQRAGATGPVAAKLDEKIADLKDEMTALQGVKEGKIDANFQFADGFLGGLSNPLNEAAKNPELLFFKLKTNAYKFSWALIPISVPFVWLLFPFSRRFGLYDHTVFVTYSLCFMMLLLAASSLIGLVSDSLAGLGWFVPPVHMYKQLRGTYGIGKRGAVWRTMLLTIFAFIAISLFGSLLVMVGAFE